MKWLVGLKREIAVLVLIVLLGAFLRFYNLSNSVSFEYDEQYNTYLVYNLVHNHKLSLIGQEMSFGGMFLGPWHYLYLVPFYIATNLHPIGGFIGEGVIGLFSVVSYYFIGKKLFGAKVGLLAAFFRAVLLPLIAIDRIITPPYPSELTSLWFIYFLVKLQEGSKKAFYILSFLFGLMFTVHLAALPLIVVWLIILVVFRPIKITFSLIAKAALFFLIPLLPQIFFEVKHQFVHLLRLVDTLVQEGQSTYDFNRQMRLISRVTIGNFIQLFDPKQNWLFGYLVIGVSIWVAFFKQRQVFNRGWLRVTAISLVVVPVYYLIYPRLISEYYLISLIPVTLLLISAVVFNLIQSKIGVALVTIFLTVVIPPNIEGLTQGLYMHKPISLSAKDRAVKSIVDHQRGKGDFSISYFMDYGREYGYQYFFTYYGLEPRQAVKPPVYSLVVPEDQVAAKDLSESFDGIGVIYPEKELQY